MIYSLIVAKDLNNGLGINDKLPWTLPSDMKWFIEKTKNKPVVMGSNTYFSLYKRPLPNRTNLVLSHDTNKRKIINDEGAKSFYTLGNVIDYSEKNFNDEIIIIGGEHIYSDFLKSKLAF